MRRSELENFRRWFSGFTKGFYSADEEHQRNIALKVKHSLLVSENMVLIAEQESPEDVLLAEATGLFHDVGRFPQYAQYGTFKDAVSVNHGELGARVLREEGVLEGLPGEEQELILTAVKYHNAFSVPRIEGPGALHLLKLVRDADKLDIWRVFIEYYGEDEGQRSSAAGLGLPETGGYSEGTLSFIHEGKSVPLRAARTLDDFKLLQLSWVYDLNFRATHRLLLERGCIEKLAAHLPRNGQIRSAVKRLEDFTRRKADA
jgi:putative nucleotidyltransferase with HDIG domain